MKEEDREKETDFYRMVVWESFINIFNLNINCAFQKFSSLCVYSPLFTNVLRVVLEKKS